MKTPELFVVESKHVDSEDYWFRPVWEGACPTMVIAERRIAKHREDASVGVVYRIARYLRVEEPEKS